MSTQFADHIVGLLQEIGPVEAKSMFGGHGIFLDGLMFGLVTDQELYLKVDDENRSEFKKRDLGPFVYEGKNRPITLSYNLAPPEAIDNAGLLAEWGRSAYAAAERATR